MYVTSYMYVYKSRDLDHALPVLRFDRYGGIKYFYKKNKLDLTLVWFVQHPPMNLTLRVDTPVSGMRLHVEYLVWLGIYLSK